MNAATVVAEPRPRSTSARSAVRDMDRTAGIVICLTVLAAVLRFARLGHQSFWYDESYTVVLVHYSPGQMLGLLPRTELTPPFYYCVAWVWAHVFGYSEAGLRSLSALAGVATVPAMYGAAGKLISRRAGLIAAALVACNPLLIWYSQEARSYAVLVLLATLSLLAFAHARVPRPDARWLIAWALAASLTLATHYYAVLAIVPQAAWLFWIHRRDRRVLLAVASAAAVGLAFLPLAISQRHNANWIARWALDRRLSQIAPQYLLGTGTPARTWLKLAGAAVLLLAGVLLARRADPAERRSALLAGALALSGFLICLVLVLAGADELITRNVILVLVPLIVLVAGGLGGRRAGRLGLAGAGILCVVGLVAAIGVAVDSAYQRPAWRSLAQTIASRPPTGAGRAVLIENYPGRYPLGLYIPGLRFIKGRGAVVNELDVIAFRGLPKAWFCWWGSTCNVPPSTLDVSISLPGLHPQGSVLHVGRFSVLRLRSNHPVRITPQQVAQALTTTVIRYDTFVLQPPA